MKNGWPKAVKNIRYGDSPLEKFETRVENEDVVHLDDRLKMKDCR